MINKRKMLFLTSILCIMIFSACGYNGTKNSTDKEVLTGYIDAIHYDSLNELSNDADYVLRGKIIDREFEWRVISRPDPDVYLNPEDMPPVTEDLVTVYTVEVLDTYLSSSKIEDRIDVLMMGGETDTTIYRFEGSPELNVNDEYIFFLSKSSMFENAGWLLNLEQSVYKVDESNISKVNGGFTLTFATLENLKMQSKE